MSPKRTPASGCAPSELGPLGLPHRARGCSCATSSVLESMRGDHASLCWRGRLSRQAPTRAPVPRVVRARARARRRRRGARRVRVVLFIGGALARPARGCVAKAVSPPCQTGGAGPAPRAAVGAARHPLQPSGRSCSAPAARRLCRCGMCRAADLVLSAGGIPRLPADGAPRRVSRRRTGGLLAAGPF